MQKQWTMVLKITEITYLNNPEGNYGKDIKINKMTNGTCASVQWFCSNTA